MTRTTATKPKRRFFQFGLRTLLLFMLVVCVTLGWKVERARKQREAVSWIQQSGGTVIYDYEILRSVRNGRSHSKVASNPKPSPPGPKWLRELVGIDFVDDVVMVFLDHGGKITDVTPLAGLKNLERLDLCQSPVSDLTPLAGMKNLQSLWLSESQVSDLTPLAGLKNLEWLILRLTQVSDLTPLAGLTNLVYLDFRGTQVSDVHGDVDHPSLAAAASGLFDWAICRWYHVSCAAVKAARSRPSLASTIPVIVTSRTSGICSRTTTLTTGTLTAGNLTSHTGRSANTSPNGCLSVRMASFIHAGSAS